MGELGLLNIDQSVGSGLRRGSILSLLSQRRVVNQLGEAGTVNNEPFD